MHTETLREESFVFYLSGIVVTLNRYAIKLSIDIDECQLCKINAVEDVLIALFDERRPDRKNVLLICNLSLHDYWARMLKSHLSVKSSTRYLGPNYKKTLEWNDRVKSPLRGSQ